MVNHYAVRLRASYEALQGTIGAWALRCDGVLCYEHVERAENIHCHLLLDNVGCSIDTLKGIMRQHGIDLKGAGQLSFKTKYKLACGDVVNITADNLGKYITYMTKGKYDPKYNKGYDPARIAQLKSEWVVYSNPYEHPLKEHMRGFDTFVSKKLSDVQNDMYNRIGLNKDIVRKWTFAYCSQLYEGNIHRQFKNLWGSMYETYCVRHKLLTDEQIQLRP